MLKKFIQQGLLALFLAAPCLLATAQTPTTNAERDRAKFGHFFEPLLADPRLTTGRLLDAAMPLTDVTAYTGTENGGGVVSGERPAAKCGGGRSNYFSFAKACIRMP